MAKSRIRLYEYQWRWMRSVTSNPNHTEYFRYGARGIQCHWRRGEYQDFINFLLGPKGPGHRPSAEHLLGRIDKLKDYEPGNLRWELPKTRSRNNPRQNVNVTYRRQNKSMSYWSEKYNIPYWTLRRRLNRGFKLGEIIKEFSQ